MSPVVSYIFYLCIFLMMFHGPFTPTISKTANKIVYSVIRHHNLFLTMHVFFSTVSNGAMVARSHSSVGCNALRVGVPTSTFQLLVILCGHLLDAQGQGKLKSSRLCLFLVWVQDREHAPGHWCHSASSFYTYFQLIHIFCFVLVLGLT